MSENNTVSSTTKYISANATLSNISVTVTTDPVEQNQLQTRHNTIPPISSPIGNQQQLQQVKQDMKQNSENTRSENATEKEDSKKQKNPISPKNKVPVSKLSIIALTLTLCLGGFVYYHGHQQATVQQAMIEALQSEISNLKQTLQSSITDDITENVNNAVEKQNLQLSNLEQRVTNQLHSQSQSQQQFIAKVDDAIKVTEQNVINFNERLAAMSTTDNKIWLISEANYLVNLAGRKIWNDQDYTTARLLLKNADASLAQANDPSLLPARQAISKDITTLAEISFTDFDGIVMTIMRLADSVTELPLVDHYNEIDLGMTNYDDMIESSASENDISDSASLSANTSISDNDEVSSSIADWYSNLVKNTGSFFAKFIQVEKYDDFSECINDAGKNPDLLKKCQTHAAVIMPEQALYLRENIKLRLFIAAQAVPRHQELIYQQALQDVSTWVNAYFDGNASSVKGFLAELTELQHQSISNINVPEQLKSRDELDKLMQTRVRAMLAN